MTDKKWIKNYDKPVQEMTFQEWLDSYDKDLPKGFVETGYANRYWDRSDPIEWAVHCYDTSQVKVAWDREESQDARSQF